MEVKLDLHCHSIASDGTLTIPELADLAVKVGLDALVVTDHCRPWGSYFSNLHILETLQALKYKLPLPVIIGSEIGTPYGEFLLFGRRAIRNWYCYRSHLKVIRDHFDMDAYFENFVEYVLHSRSNSYGGGIDADKKALSNSKKICKLPYAMIVCHPSAEVHHYERFPDVLWEHLHGFEIQNDYTEFDKESPEVVEYLKSKIKNCKLLRNSDCHMQELGRVFNTFTFKPGAEINEGNLIHALVT